MDGGIRSNEAGAFNMQSPRIEHLPTSDIESENSENIEEDVNICDICGDAGQEEKLVICTRCDEGAEHTYCMPIKLNDLPEGDWLCEGCQMDKSKIQNANKSETTHAASEVPCLDPKLDPEFCAKAKGQEAESAYKEPGGQKIADEEPGGQKIADGKNTGSVEIISLASKKDTINGSGPPNIPTTGENVGFSNENPSSILDVQKVKASTSAANNSKPVYRAQISSVSNPLSMKAGIQSSQGPLWKSASFNSRTQPKVKQLTGPAPSMRKIVSGNVQNSTSREGLIRKLGKSASCKGMRSSYSNVESMSKVRSVLHWADDKRGSKKVEERNITEKRSFFTSDSEAAVASESEALAFNRQPEDTNHLAKKPSAYLSKSYQNPSSDKVGNSEHHKLFQDLPNSIPRPNSLAADRSSQQTTHQSALLSRNNKTKDLGVGSSKQAGSNINRVLRCQKCNEAGHTAQYCSITKFSVSVVKPSADWNLKEPRGWNLKEPRGSSNKLKDVVQAEISKTTIQNSKRSINESVKPLLPLTDISCDVASRDPLSNSASRVEETTDDKENSRFVPHTTNTGKPQFVQQVGPLSVPCESNLNSSPDEAPVLARALVIPEMEFIWQGDFDVLKAGRHPELCDRMQAYLSTTASPKVLEVAAKFPYRIEVDEVPRLSSWPLTFLERSPREDNIALFFFAKDNESYEQNYRNLVDNMLENDLALKGSIDGLELLIFPSNVLPKDSQRWNGLFFLWAVFRGRASNSLKPFADSRQKPGGSTSNAVSLPTPLIPEVSTSPKASLNANHNKELSTRDQPFDQKAVNIDADSDPRKNASPVDVETSSDLKEGVEASGNEEEQRPTKAEAVTYTDTQKGDVMVVDPLSWNPSLNRKRAHTVLTGLTSDRRLESTGEAAQSPKVEFFSFGLVDEVSKKKMKIEAQKPGNCNPREESSSGKSRSRLSGERERSVGLGTAMETEPEKVIYVLSDDESSSEPDSPNLELALGTAKKSS